MALAKKRILLIDDNIDILELNKEILTMGGYEVFSAVSGEDGFAILAKITPPDLILLDLQMENMSGGEFLLELEKRRPDILKYVPVAFLTGRSEIPASRAVGVIKKPFTITKLLEAVRNFVAK